MIHNEIIADAFDNGINDDNINDVSNAVRETLSNLDNGNIRVAEKSNGDWHVNESAKKAILLSFKLNQNKCIETSYTKFYDKVDSKFSHTSEEYLKEKNIRELSKLPNISEGPFFRKHRYVIYFCAP